MNLAPLGCGAACALASPPLVLCCAIRRGTATDGVRTVYFQNSNFGFEDVTLTK